MRTTFRNTLFILGLACSSNARANPFNMKQGDGRVIVSGFLTASPKQFDDDGHVINAPDYDQFNIYVNGEYGLTDDVNLIVNPSFRSIKIEGDDNDSTGLGYTDLGLRYQFAKGSNWVLDAQGLVRIAGTGRNVGVAQIGNNDTQVDLRVLGGYGTQRFFLTLEGSYRIRSGRPPSEYHADLALGMRATPKLLAIASIQNTISDGRGSKRPISIGDNQTFNYNYAYRYHDIALSAVYSVTPRIAVQAGATATVAGRNALRQRGPFVGVWFNF